MTLNLDKSYKDTITLVEFAVGEFPGKVYHRMNDSTVNLVHRGELYVSTPSINLDLPLRTGGLNEEPCKISLALSDNPLQAIDDFVSDASSGRSYPPVLVTISELVKTDRSESATQEYFLYEGRLIKTFRNPSGKSNVVELVVGDEKFDLEVNMGLTADAKCSWTFGGNGCYLDPYKVADCWLETFGNNPFQVKVNHANPTLITAPFYEHDSFTLGYLLKDGLSILIREHKGNATRDLVLAEVPPDDWIDNSASPSSTGLLLVSGCRKLEKHCIARANTEFHTPIGYATPEYNPAFEEV